MEKNIIINTDNKIKNKQLNKITDTIQSQSDTGSTPEEIMYKGNTLVQEVLSRLQDDTLVERYGTSLEYGTEHDYSLYLHKKYYKLKYELLKFFNNLDQLISCKDLQMFFSLYEEKTRVRLSPVYIERLYEDLFIDVNIQKPL